MIVGFTGTHHGMSVEQQDRVWWLLKEFHSLERGLFIHGGCIGADTQAHDIALALGWFGQIEVYPSDIKNKWGKHWNIETQAKIHQSMRPLFRNELMMERADIVLAAPRRMEEERRSGTWHAIRWAKRLQRRPFKIHKRILIIWRNGTVEEHDGTTITSFTGKSPNLNLSLR